jgi:hypothetical protein
MAGSSNNLAAHILTSLKIIYETLTSILPWPPLPLDLHAQYVDIEIECLSL